MAFTVISKNPYEARLPVNLFFITFSNTVSMNNIIMLCRRVALTLNKGKLFTLIGGYSARSVRSVEVFSALRFFSSFVLLHKEGVATIRGGLRQRDKSARLKEGKSSSLTRARSEEES